MRECQRHEGTSNLFTCVFFDRFIATTYRFYIVYITVVREYLRRVSFSLCLARFDYLLRAKEGCNEMPANSQDCSYNFQFSLVNLFSAHTVLTNQFDNNSNERDGENALANTRDVDGETVSKMFYAFTHLFSLSFSSFFPYVFFFPRYIFARAVTESIIHINVIVSSVFLQMYVCTLVYRSFLAFSFVFDFFLLRRNSNVCILLRFRTQTVFFLFSF